MKILCLHGKGTSGRIFKSQTGMHDIDYHRPINLYTHSPLLTDIKLR